MSDEYDDEYDDDDFDDDVDDDDVDDDDTGNRIVGARARAVVEHCAGNIVDEVDELDVESEESGGEVTLLIHASPSDMGRLIGRRGRVIQAMRQLVRAAGASEDIKATVDVVE
ncbi:MAG: KH domain-containing protein [Acidimicrobiia bacterium]|nr:KH domain-containing protein [Acidimicrobiia bacterium]